MELSQRAQERLASIGELTAEERERAKFAEELDKLLSDYFTGKLAGDELWRKLKQHQEDGHNYVIREAQLKILNSLVLDSSSIVFAQCRQAILGCEGLKEQNDRAGIEASISALESIQKQYRQERDLAFENMKHKMRAGIESAAMKVARQSNGRQGSVDIDASIDASIKTSPEWKEFMQTHDSVYNPGFGDQKDMIRKQLNK